MLIALYISFAHPCEDCLKNYLTHFYCVTTQQCLPLSEISGCPNREHHDLVLNATQCCHYIQTESECLGRETLNFCLWCPAHVHEDQPVRQQCLYKSDPENIRKNCHTTADITSHCSIYTDCESCSADLPCAWCSTSQKCVTSFRDPDVIYDDPYKCEDNLMKFDQRQKQCLCKGSKYLDSNTRECIGCPANTTVSPQHDTCLCKQLADFDKGNKKCNCVDNSYLKFGICTQCPKNSYSNMETCICLDTDAVFQEDIGKCVCKQGFNEWNGGCLKCPNGAEYNEVMGCRCAKGEWDQGKNVCKKKWWK